MDLVAKSLKSVGPMFIYYVNIYIADASFPPDNEDGAID
jgi:hypothetical protein